MFLMFRPPWEVWKPFSFSDITEKVEKEAVLFNLVKRQNFNKIIKFRQFNLT